MNKMTNLPAAYANLYGYSDVRPYEVVSISKSGKQITIRSMKFERDQTWQPEFDMGGFVAHCVNQIEQRWLIESDPDGYTMKAHKRADGYFHSPYGKHRIDAKPRAFYDYNF
jgi:hypothetical protein